MWGLVSEPSVPHCDTRPLRAGFDCAGMGSAMEALASLDRNVTMAFASEVDDSTRRHLSANFKVLHQISDLFDRSRQEYRHVDLYVA